MAKEGVEDVLVVGSHAKYLTDLESDCTVKVANNLGPTNGMSVYVCSCTTYKLQRTTLVISQATLKHQKHVHVGAPSL